MGPWGIGIAVLVGASFTQGGREFMRKAVKTVIRAGYEISDKSKNAVGDLKDKASDLVAEIKAEDGEENGAKAKSTKSKSDKANHDS
jgi:hypothetical protein